MSSAMSRSYQGIPAPQSPFALMCAENTDSINNFVNGGNVTYLSLYTVELAKSNALPKPYAVQNQTANVGSDNTAIGVQLEGYNLNFIEFVQPLIDSLRTDAGVLNLLSSNTRRCVSFREQVAACSDANTADTLAGIMTNLDSSYPNWDTKFSLSNAESNFTTFRSLVREDYAKLDTAQSIPDTVVTEADMWTFSKSAFFLSGIAAFWGALDSVGAFPTTPVSAYVVPFPTKNSRNSRVVTTVNYTNTQLSSTVGGQPYGVPFYTSPTKGKFRVTVYHPNTFFTNATGIPGLGIVGPTTYFSPFQTQIFNAYNTGNAFDMTMLADGNGVYGTMAAFVIADISSSVTLDDAGPEWTSHIIETKGNSSTGKSLFSLYMPNPIGTAFTNIIVIEQLTDDSMSNGFTVHDFVGGRFGSATGQYYLRTSLDGSMNEALTFLKYLNAGTNRITKIMAAQLGAEFAAINALESVNGSTNFPAASDLTIASNWGDTLLSWEWWTSHTASPVLGSNAIQVISFQDKRYLYPKWVDLVATLVEDNLGNSHIIEQYLGTRVGC